MVFYQDMKEGILEAPDLQGILNKSHEDKWIAFTSDYKKIIAESETIGDLIGRLGNERILSEKPIFYKVPSSVYSFSPVT